MTLSLQKWKERAADKHRQIRALRVKVRDLQISRDAWKRRALAATASASESPSPGEAGPGRP